MDVAHDFLRPVMHRQAVLVDGTLGPGQDTSFLLKRAGRVIAYDIQPEAVERVRARVQDERLEVRLESHEKIADLPFEIDGAIFNFGWCPGLDHGVTTLPESSLRAVQAAFERLRVKGRIALVFYPHMEGQREADVVLKWLGSLDPRRGPVQLVSVVNSPRSPFAVLVEKRK